MQSSVAGWRGGGDAFAHAAFAMLLLSSGGFGSPFVLGLLSFILRRVDFFRTKTKEAQDALKKVQLDGFGGFTWGARATGIAIALILVVAAAGALSLSALCLVF